MLKKILSFFLLMTSSLAYPAETEVSVIILGGGVAALTSATYLGRAGVSPLVITGATVGGAITQSHNVENWPGELSISGIDLTDKLVRQAGENGAVLVPEEVVSVDFSKRPFVITTKQVFAGTIKTYRAQSCIIALGAKPKFLGVPGEATYFSNGVYSCAVCDGGFYKDQVVAIVGGGDSALIEAQYLANIAKRVHVIVRKDRFRAVEAQRIKEVLALPNVTVHFNTVVSEVKGDKEKVSELVLNDSEQLPVNALFLAIGANPNTGLFRGQLEMDDEGYIVLKKHQQTSVEGVFAVGDIADPEFKQAVSAAGDGAKAALQAQKFVSAVSASQKQIAEKSTAAAVIEIHSREQFERELKSAEGAIFVDFYSNQCPPCRAFAPIYASWAKEFGQKIKFLKVNPDHERSLFELYQIRGIPTLIILDSKGKVIKKSVGTYEISEVNQHLESLKSKQQLFPDDFR